MSNKVPLVDSCVWCLRRLTHNHNHDNCGQHQFRRYGRPFFLQLLVEESSVTNTLGIPITIKSISAELGTGGNVILAFEHSFSSFTVAAGATSNTGTITDATFTDSAIAALRFLLLTNIDIIDASVGLGWVVYRNIWLSPERNRTLPRISLQESAIPAKWAILSIGFKISDS